MRARALLRITEISVGGQPVAWVRLQDGESVQESIADLRLTSDAADDELIRWYLEDYPAFPRDPAPHVAERAEKRLAAMGEELFLQLFGSEPGAALWSRVLQRFAGLCDLRVEIDPDPQNVPGHRWELLRDPASEQVVALEAAEFVRISREAQSARAWPAEPGDGELRVLVVICRPAGDRDVPFRSIASKLIRSETPLAGLNVEVLRPPTFEQLTMKLREAARLGRPFHVVHFDGHGDYLDAAHSQRGNAAGESDSGKRGYLLFEQDRGEGIRLVDGAALGTLLASCDVPVLVLNACRSAYAEPLAEPLGSDTESEPPARSAAYGALASEIAGCGVPGVVAMRYNVFVGTAAEFVGNLYAKLAACEPLGQAVKTARVALATHALRKIGTVAVRLEDWTVPVLYEARPLRLTRAAGDTAASPQSIMPDSFPSAPESGVVGRDETLLLLDRGFDRHRVIVLYGLAGAGKSTAAAEFARWYRDTGGLRWHLNGTGPVMWTSFQYHVRLGEVLTWMGEVFRPILAARGVEWETVSPPDRSQVVLEFLNNIPILWVWDNVEAVAGFPAASDSPWAADEQRELREFLEAVADRTRWKILLTSRRDERIWLGSLPSQIRIPALPLQDRLELLKALVERTGVAIANLDWRPLLRFSQGNALTLTVLARVVDDLAVHSTEELSDLLRQLQSGERPLEVFTGSQAERELSLTASLDYSLVHVFTDAERRVLSLLHLFCGTVHVHQLLLIGEPEVCGDDALRELAVWSEDELTRLLENAVDLGLLTGQRSGFYEIHPALPWYLESMFRGYWGERARQCERAYARVLAGWSEMLTTLTSQGHLMFARGILFGEERNLHRAIEVAQREELPDAEIGCLAGLHLLLTSTGRISDWAEVLQPTVPCFLADLEHPIAGREDYFTTILGYLAELANRNQNQKLAVYTQAILAAHAYVRAMPYLNRSVARLTLGERALIKKLIIAITQLGDLQRARPVPACMRLYRTALHLLERYRIQDRRLEAVIRSGIGMVFTELGWYRDLEQAQWWLTSALEKFPEHDVQSRSVCAANLTRASYRRYLEARQLGEPAAEQRQQIFETMRSWEQAIADVPFEDHELLSRAYGELGSIYRDLRAGTEAMNAFRLALQHAEAGELWYNYAFAQYAITRLYARERRYEDALRYAEAAYQTLSAAVPDDQGLRRQVEEYLMFLPEYLKRERGEQTWLKADFRWQDSLTDTLLADADLEEEAFPELGDFDPENMELPEPGSEPSAETGRAFFNQIHRWAMAKAVREQRSGAVPEWLTEVRERRRNTGGVTLLTGIYGEGHSTIVSAGRDAVLRRWSMGEGEEETSIPVGSRSGEVRAISGTFAEDADVIVSTAMADYSVFLWQMRRGSLSDEELTSPTVLSGHRGPVNATMHGIWQGQPVVVSASDDGTIRTWSLTGTPLNRPMIGHTGSVRALALLENGADTLIVSGGDDSTVRLWNLAGGKESADPRKGHRGPILAVTDLVHDGQKCIVSVGADLSARFWNPADRHDVKRIWLPSLFEQPQQRRPRGPDRMSRTAGKLIYGVVGPNAFWWEHLWTDPPRQRATGRLTAGHLIAGSNDHLIAVGSGTTVLTLDASGTVRHRLISRVRIRAMTFCGSFLVLGTDCGIVAMYAGESDVDAARMMFLNEL